MPETRAQRSSWRDLRRLPRHGSNPIDVVGAAGAGVHPAGYAVLQAKRRALLGAPGVRVDVDQPRCDDLAARVDRLAGVALDGRPDRGNAAAADRKIADQVEADRRIDDASFADEKVIRLRREYRRNPRQQRSTCDRGCKPASTDHGPTSP